MNRELSPLRAGSVALAVALLLFGAWHSWREFQQKRANELAQERRAHADSLIFRFAHLSDSLCRRGFGDTLLVRDPVEWAMRRHGLRLESRGREGRWDWGCLGTSDSGFVLLVARDSGCVRFSGGALWSDDCHVATLIHDRLTKASTFPQNTTFSRSLWAYPGAHRVCPSSKRPEPPAWDSLAANLCLVRL